MALVAAGNKKSPYGPAQARFIKKTRESITGDPRFFEKNEWSRIVYKAGVSRSTCLNRSSKDPPITVDSFYVKDIAVWHISF
jgi:hypothetical protein